MQLFLINCFYMFKLGDWVMVYYVNNIVNKTLVTGATGNYDNKTNDPNVKYGRNAVSNYKEYLSDLSNPTNPLDTKTDKYIPVKYKLNYLPEDKVEFTTLNKQALLGASYEDLGAAEKSVSELNKMGEKFSDQVSYEAFDVNGDGKISVDENAVAILIKDMADNHPTDEVLTTGKLDINTKDLDGACTETGDTNLWSFLKKDKVAASKQLVTQIYQAFGLDKAKTEFLKDNNNIAE